ncbi:UNVERIFIED_ORG: hypothetical protein GGE11_005570 [Mycolicibacterium obuense]
MRCLGWHLSMPGEVYDSPEKTRYRRFRYVHPHELRRQCVIAGESRLRITRVLSDGLASMGVSLMVMTVGTELC